MFRADYMQKPADIWLPQSEMPQTGVPGCGILILCMAAAWRLVC